MTTHQVEVDDEVFAFVKSHAEPLVDNFNSSLRRLLPLTAKTTKSSAPAAATAGTLTFPTGMSTPRILDPGITRGLRAN